MKVHLFSYSYQAHKRLLPMLHRRSPEPALHFHNFPQHSTSGTMIWHFTSSQWFVIFLHLTPKSIFRATDQKTTTQQTLSNSHMRTRHTIKVQESCVIISLTGSSGYPAGSRRWLIALFFLIKTWCNIREKTEIPTSVSIIRRKTASGFGLVDPLGREREKVVYFNQSEGQGDQQNHNNHDVQYSGPCATYLLQ